MDQIKIGKYIAGLRKKNGWTQQQLADKIGVTNKTISRWENGNYMPDIEMLQILSRIFDVSIHELLAGEPIEDQTFRKKADENIIAVAKESAFTLEEKKKYHMHRWRRDHIALLILLALIFIGLFVVIPFVLDIPWLTCFAPIGGMVEYMWQSNKMMTYVEKSIYKS